MRVRPTLIAAAAIGVLAMGCSAGPVGPLAEPASSAPAFAPALSATASAADSAWSRIPGPAPTVKTDLGEHVDHTWVVRHNGIELGVAGVGHTNDDQPGVEAAFEPSETLEQAAEAIGVSHFNWYQYLVKDNDPPKDTSGERLVAPFVDPPCGGYGGRDRDWADKQPWYWDETAPPRSEFKHADPGNQLQENIEGQVLLLSDAPGGAPGTRLEFRSYLAGVPESDGDPVFLGGWTWKFKTTWKGVQVTDVAPLPQAGPDPEEYGLSLAGGSCRL